MNAIMIPLKLKEERPDVAEFCGLINETLEYFPDMSLAKFAAILNEENIALSLARIEAAESKQFGREAIQ